MEAVSESLASLDKKDLQKFISICLERGILPLEASAAVLHRLKFERVTAQHPWKNDLGVILHIVPSDNVFFCLGDADLIALSTTARGLHGLYKSSCVCWVAKCVAAGITPPSGFSNVEALSSLHAIGFSTHGGDWILRNDEELDSLLAVGDLILRAQLPGQRAWRLSFRLAESDVDGLRDRFSDWLDGLPSDNFGGLDFGYDLLTDIAGVPNCQACLSICYDDEELAFKCAVGIVYDEDHDAADIFGEHCSHLSFHMVTIDNTRVLDFALQPEVPFSTRSPNGLRQLRGPFGTLDDDSEDLDDDSEELGDQLTAIHDGALWLESERAAVEVSDDEDNYFDDSGAQLCPKFVTLLRTLLNGDDYKCLLVWEAPALS